MTEIHVREYLHDIRSLFHDNLLHNIPDLTVEVLIHSVNQTFQHMACGPPNRDFRRCQH